MSKKLEQKADKALDMDFNKALSNLDGLERYQQSTGHKFRRMVVRFKSAKPVPLKLPNHIFI